MEKLKRLREEHGLSQVKLAARADLNPATVNQIERGMRNASPGTLHKLADALGVSLHELLETDEERRVRAFLAAHPSEDERVRTLEKTASIIGGYNERWSLEIAEIEERGTFPYGKSIEMRALLEFVSDAMTHQGIRDYVEGVGVEASVKEKAATIRLQTAWVEMSNLVNRMREVERTNRESASEETKQGLQPLEDTPVEVPEKVQPEAR